MLKDTVSIFEFYNLHNVLKQGMRSDDYNLLLNIYFKILDSTRTDIPDDLQKEWLMRREPLGLSGKFLPDNSKLKGYL